MVVIVLINFITAGIFFVELKLPSGFYDGLEEANDGCMLMSNVWPYINYLGIHSEPFPSKELVKENIDNGKRILLYKVVPEPYYTFNRTFVESLPVIKETDSYLIMGDNTRCAPLENVDKSYLNRLEERDYQVKLHPFLPLLEK